MSFAAFSAVLQPQLRDFVDYVRILAPWFLLGFYPVFLRYIPSTSTKKSQRVTSPDGWNVSFLQIQRSLGYSHDNVQAPLISLVQGDGPVQNQSQERSYFSCLQASRNFYLPTTHTKVKAKTSSMNQPTKAKFC